MKNPYKVLVVDDNEMICHLLNEMLSSEGYSVTTASRGDTALKEIQKEPYHLVMLDLKLPGVHGIQVMHEIRKDFPETDVIIMTSQASVETAVEALRLGAQDYLTKPFEDLEIVSQLVKKYFEKRQMVDDNQRLNKELKEKTEKLESSVKRLSTLNEVGQALHTIRNIKELLNFFVNVVAAELEAQRVSLMLLNRETNELMIEASVGLDDKLVKTTRVLNGEGISGWVTQKGEAVLVKDINEDVRFNKRPHCDKYDTNSFISAPLVLSVPIKYMQNSLGVININNKQDGGIFTENDLEFVTILASQAAIAIENARMFEKLKETHFEAIMALAEALEAKDATTGKHSDRILRFAIQVAGRLGLDEEAKERLRYAAVLHDIGKIGIPEKILQKPGKLSEEEYNIIKTHPDLGMELTQKIQFLSSVAPLISAHHERYDGKGYPLGLSDAQIPVEARIVSVMDAYDAMTSDRPYRKSLGKTLAIEELKNCSGSQFDPQIVEAFLGVLEEQECREERERQEQHHAEEANLCEPVCEKK